MLIKYYTYDRTKRKIKEKEKETLQYEIRAQKRAS